MHRGASTADRRDLVTGYFAGRGAGTRARGRRGPARGLYRERGLRRGSDSHLETSFRSALEKVGAVHAQEPVCLKTGDTPGEVPEGSEPGDGRVARVRTTHEARDSRRQLAVSVQGSAVREMRVV